MHRIDPDSSYLSPSLYISLTDQEDDAGAHPYNRDLARA